MAIELNMLPAGYQVELVFDYENTALQEKPGLFYISASRHFYRTAHIGREQIKGRAFIGYISRPCCKILVRLATLSILLVNSGAQFDAAGIR